MKAFFLFFFFLVCEFFMLIFFICHEKNATQNSVVFQEWVFQQSTRFFPFFLLMLFPFVLSSKPFLDKLSMSSKLNLGGYQHEHVVALSSPESTESNLEDIKQLRSFSKAKFSLFSPYYLSYAGLFLIYSQYECTVKLQTRAGI